MMAFRSFTAAALTLALGCGPALAEEEMPVVPVNGMKKPEMRNYRAVWAGLEAFDEERKLAPQASLHFRMVPKNSGASVPIEDVTLKIVGDDDPLMVPIAADGLFTMPRSQAAYDSDALLVLNRRAGLLRANPDIRTPGLPDNVRRMGDLRLECQVMVAVAKEEIGFMWRATINSLMLTSDWCRKKDMHIGFRAGRPVVEASLVHGERRKGAEVKNGEFTVPIGDATWPDDTLVELKFEET
jgi:hypothetical protein